MTTATPAKTYADESGSFGRQVKRLDSQSRRSGWSVEGKPEPDFFVVRQLLGEMDGLGHSYKKLTAKRISSGKWHVEISTVTRKPKSGQMGNRLNVEGESVEHSGQRILEWDGKRTFTGPEAFNAVREYMEFNPDVAPDLSGVFS